MDNTMGTIEKTAARNGNIPEIKMPDKKVGARATLEGMGATDVTWQPDTNGITAKVNGQTMYYDASKLNNNNGTLEGSQQDINDMIKGGKTQVRQAGVMGGVSVGYDQHGNPMYNGQVLDTTGMVNIGNRWYGNSDYLNQVMGAVKNEYTDPYAGKRNDLLDRMLNYKAFSYDAAGDTNLQSAMELARRAAMRSAVDRGQGNSFGAEYAAAAAANDLIPQYEDKAYQRYLAERDYLGQLMGYVNDAANTDLSVWAANQNQFNADREYNATEQHYGEQNALAREQLDYTKGQDALDRQASEDALKKDMALQRAQIFGYVSEEDADILGVQAGTPTIALKQHFDSLALEIAQILGYAPAGVAERLGVAPGAYTLSGEDAYRSWNKTPSGKYKTGNAGSNPFLGATIAGWE